MAAEFRDFDAAAAIVAAQDALSREAGGRVEIGASEALGDETRRNLVLRATATGADGSRQAIIIKATRAATYDAKATDVFQTQGLAREWAALRLLSASNHAPRLLASDVATGVLVVADCGAVASLVGPLLEGSAAEAEAALTSYAVALAGLHAATPGCRAAHSTVVLDGFPRAVLPAAGAGWIEGVARPVVDRLGGAFPEAEIMAVLKLLTAPGPWQALVHRDPCPDNVLLASDGRALLIDFEFAAPGHALLDTAYWRVGFPTCWCAGVVPPAVADRLDAAYCAAIAEAVPVAADQAAFRHERGLIAIATLFGALAWQLPPALAEESRWGIAGRRARIMHYLDAASEIEVLPRLQDLIRGWRRDLASRWPEVEPLPVYAAFKA